MGIFGGLGKVERSGGPKLPFFEEGSHIVKIGKIFAGETRGRDPMFKVDNTLVETNNEDDLKVGSDYLFMTIVTGKTREMDEKDIKSFLAEVSGYDFDEPEDIATFIGECASDELQAAFDKLDLDKPSDAGTALDIFWEALGDYAAGVDQPFLGTLIGLKCNRTEGGYLKHFYGPLIDAED